jgi:hypothetical protein
MSNARANILARLRAVAPQNDPAAATEPAAPPEADSTALTRWPDSSG